MLPLFKKHKRYLPPPNIFNMSGISYSCRYHYLLGCYSQKVRRSPNSLFPPFFLLAFFLIIIFPKVGVEYPSKCTDASGSVFPLQPSIVLYCDMPITLSFGSLSCQDLPVVASYSLFFCLKGVVNWITAHVLCLIPKSQKAGKF